MIGPFYGLERRATKRLLPSELSGERRLMLRD
jgi:hypothetical protein